MMNSEKGQVLPLVLLVLAVGGLVITPFIGHVSSNLIGSRVYGQAISEQYSCDAGIECAIWHLQSGESEVPEGEELELPEFTINNKTVNVAIEDEGEQIYRITSTATSDDGSSTTIEANVLVVAAGDVPEGYATFPNGFTLEDGSYIGNVYVEGDVSLIDQSKIEGSVIATGNAYLDDHCTITGTLCAGGDVYLVDQCTITLNVYAESNVYLDDYCTINGDVYVYAGEENVHLSDGSSINGEIYTYQGCPLYGCGGSILIQTWAIMHQ